MSPPAEFKGGKKRDTLMNTEGDLTASSKATLTKQGGSSPRSSNQWFFNFKNQRNNRCEQDNFIVDKWIKKKPDGFKSTITESSETSSINSRNSQKSANVSI